MFHTLIAGLGRSGRGAVCDVRPLLATFINQPPGESTASRCCRDMAYQRAYVSYTASSASAREPSSQYARLISRR